MSLALLSLVFLPGAFSAVLELPVLIKNGYAVVDVEVGTPPVSHTLLFDTGSSTSWIVADECDKTEYCPNISGYDRTPYNSSSSSTYHSAGEHASIDYLGGLTAGIGVEDVWSTTSAPEITWTQSFLEVNASSWANIPADGFLGLAFTTIADAHTTTMVETLMQSGHLDQSRFGLYYGLKTDESGDSLKNGSLTIGGSHEDIYIDGDLAWTDLQRPGADAQLWRVDMQFAVGTTTNHTQSTVPMQGAWGIFDTGASRISVGDAYIEDIYRSIGMNWTAIINHEHIPLCEEFTDEWSVEFQFGSSSSPTKITLTGDMLKLSGFATGEDKYCWPPFDKSGADGMFLFGKAFLSRFYTVFDFGGFTPDNYHGRIGFGSLKEGYKPESS